MGETLPTSYIQVGADGKTTSFVGPEAVGLYAAVALKHGIKMWVEVGMIPNKNYTPRRMLAKAAEIVGAEKPFALSKLGGRGAIHQLDKWIEARKAKLPVVKHG